MPTKSAVATPRAWRSPTIVLGPVSVAVGLKTLTRDEAIHAKTLCPCHTLPIKQAATCQIDGTLVEPIKRYEHGDTYVELDPHDFEAESDYTLTLTAAPHDEDVDSAYFGKPYLIWPKPGYEQQFDMLAAAVRASGRTLIGTVVLTKTTEVLAVEWSDEFDVLIAHTLHYAENINTAEIDLVRDAADARPAPNAEYVDLLTTLIEKTLTDSYDADAYTNDYRGRLREAIEAAANGTPIPRPAAAESSAPVVDLMAALKASVAEASKPKPAAKTATKKPAPKKTTAAKAGRAASKKSAGIAASRSRRKKVA